MNTHMLNLIGLVLNGTGALVLVFCPPPIPAREVMEDGTEKIASTYVLEGFFPEKSKTKRIRNRLKYLIRKYGFRIGVLCLAVGFLFQLLAELR